MPAILHKSLTINGTGNKKVAYAGCTFDLQVEGSKPYISMTYHLIQPASQPVMIKGQAWFLDQLRQVLQEEEAEQSSDTHRSFFMFEHKYIDRRSCTNPPVFLAFFCLWLQLVQSSSHVSQHASGSAGTSNKSCVVAQHIDCV